MELAGSSRFTGCRDGMSSIKQYLKSPLGRAARRRALDEYNRRQRVLRFLRVSSATEIKQQFPFLKEEEAVAIASLQGRMQWLEIMKVVSPSKYKRLRNSKFVGIKALRNTQATRT